MNALSRLEHVAYYEEQRQGLGARYLAAFDAAMLKVCEHLDAIVPEFPYNFLHRQSGEDIEGRLHQTQFRSTFN